MSRFLGAFTRSLRMTVVAIMMDVGLAYGMMFFGFGFIEVAGDLILIEAAGLFLIGGLIDFSSSSKAFQLRRMFMESKEEYSISARRQAESRVIVMFLAGLTLLGVLILGAVLNTL